MPREHPLEIVDELIDVLGDSDAFLLLGGELLGSRSDLDHCRGDLLIGGSGITLDGGGVFTTEPITRTRTSITENHPNQCSGC
jgi:hypothetical protein